MPAKGWRKYTPEQLTKLSMLYGTMPLKQAAAQAGMTFSAAQWQLHQGGLARKPFSAIVEFKPFTLTERELYYLAGLVDGEGTVTIRLRPRERPRLPSWNPCVIVSNTDRRLMDWLLAAFPTPSAYVDSRQVLDHATSYRFWAAGLGYLPLFKALEPALVLKADLMRLVIEWTELRLSQFKTDPLTPRQHEIISLIRARNMKPSRRSPLAT